MTSVIADSATHTLGPSTIAPQIIPAEMAAVTLHNHSALRKVQKHRQDFCISLSLCVLVRLDLSYLCPT